MSYLKKAILGVMVAGLVIGCSSEVDRQAAEIGQAVGNLLEQEMGVDQPEVTSGQVEELPSLPSFASVFEAQTESNGLNAFMQSMTGMALGAGIALEEQTAILKGDCVSRPGPIREDVSGEMTFKIEAVTDHVGDVTIVVAASRIDATMKMEGAALQPAFANLANRRPERFEQACGSHYVSGFDLGAMFGIRLYALAAEQTPEIEAHLSKLLRVYKKEEREEFVEAVRVLLANVNERFDEHISAGPVGTVLAREEMSDNEDEVIALVENMETYLKKTENVDGSDVISRHLTSYGPLN